MSKIQGKTIAIRAVTGRPARKITKIIGYGAQGFAVVTPYHAARAGFVGKMPIDYKEIGQLKVPRDEIVGFTANNRVKLSYHPDGFVQFSGETQGAIISGRDPTNGQPKGVALMSQPLSSPVRSGPTFGITAWGLHDFSALPDTDAVSPATVLFEPDDLYFRGTTPSEANGIILEVFAFPKRYWAGVRKRGRDYVLTIAFNDFEASRAAIDLKVIDIPGQDIMLAGFASNAQLTFPSDSGWVLSGPGSATPDGKGHVLVAYYPPNTLNMEGLPSLDR